MSKKYEELKKDGNMDKIPICLVIGSGRVDTLSRKYEGDAKRFLDKCRRTARKHTGIFTSEPRVVAAFQALHELGEVELHIQRVVNGVEEFRVDEKGQIIEPWPDEFFEVEFNLRFHAKEL